jgi:hypothetical protein
MKPAEYIACSEKPTNKGATIAIQAIAPLAAFRSEFEYLEFPRLQWLTPFYTRGHSFNDSTVQNLITTYGFRYATDTETLNMVNNNFNNPITTSPGNAAGFASAQSFFSVFGINQSVSCGLPCPRTQGLTSAAGSSANTHLAFGMIELGSNGWFIVNNSWSDSSTDIQLGSWLVRTVQVPEPSTLYFLGLVYWDWQRGDEKRLADTAEPKTTTRTITAVHLGPPFLFRRTATSLPM